MNQLDKDNERFSALVRILERRAFDYRQNAIKQYIASGMSEQDAIDAIEDFSKRP